MSEEKKNDGSGPPTPDNSGTYHQELQHNQLSARVPEHVGRGVFSTGAIVMHGSHEFVIDFLQSMTMPRRVAARVVLPLSVVGLFQQALTDNLQKFQQNFGPVQKLPQPQPSTPGGQPPAPPPIADVYEQLKLPDEVMSGVYANTVMIVHTPAEFCFDFITNFFPRSAVSARVYLAAPHVPQLLDSITRSLEQFRKRLQPNPGGPQPATPGAAPIPPPPPSAPPPSDKPGETPPPF